jgi:hypothetical protein
MFVARTGAMALRQNRQGGSVCLIDDHLPDIERIPANRLFFSVFFPLEFRRDTDIAIDLVRSEDGQPLSESLAENDSPVTNL